MGDSPRYRNLRDYLRVLRDHRLLILVATVVFAAAGYFISNREQKTYRAETTLSCTDVSVDQGLTGDQAPNSRTPENESAVCAQYATRRDIGNTVAKRLHNPSVRGAVGAHVEATTGLVAIQVTSHDPRFGARAANEFARETVKVRTAALRRRIHRAVAAERSAFDKGATRATRLAPIIRAAFAERTARLEALAGFARPVQVIQSAEPPTTAISPRPVRSAILAAVVGLTLGLVAAFVRDSLDRRLREPQDVQSELGMPLLASISRGAFGVAGAMRNGRGPAPEQDVEAFRILRRNLHFLVGNSPLRSIAVTSAVAQEGKSTVAASLAWSNVYAGEQTLLIDCDLRRGHLASRLGLAPAPGLSDYLVGKAELGDIVQTVGVEHSAAFSTADSGTAPSDGLAFISAGSPAERPTELLESQAFKDVLAVLSRAYKRLILDTSPLLPVADTLAIAPMVDAILVCVRASQTTRDEAAATRSALQKVPGRPAGAVVTGVRRGTYPNYGYYGSGAASERIQA